MYLNKCKQINLGAFKQQRRKIIDAKQGFSMSVNLTRHVNILSKFKRTVCEDVGWIHLAQDMNP